MPSTPQPRPAVEEYDGYAPVHYCDCCGRVIGDGDWAVGIRTCAQLRARLHRLIRSARR